MADPASDPTEPLLRAPQQDRSRRTLERMLRAAAALLEDGGMDALTVTAVTRRARASVGSFYARFAGKEDLVRYLGERSMAEALAEWEWEGEGEGAAPAGDAVLALERLAGSYAEGPARLLVLLDGQDDPRPRRLRRYEDTVGRVLAPLLDPDAPDARSTFHRAVALVAAVRELTLRGPAGEGSGEAADPSLSPSVVARVMAPLVGAAPSAVGEELAVEESAEDAELAAASAEEWERAAAQVTEDAPAGPEGAAEGEEREAAVEASPSEVRSEPEAGAPPEDEAAPERPLEEEEEAEAEADLFDPWG